MTKEYYNRNRKKIKETAKRWTIAQRKKLRDWIITLKSNTECSRCRTSYPWYVMTLGNRDIPRLVNKGVSVKTLHNAVCMNEMFCANCRKITQASEGMLTDLSALS